jgi:hypothetical protein
VLLSRFGGFVFLLIFLYFFGGVEIEHPDQMDNKIFVGLR